jgi:hypothetical protein
MPPAGLCRVWYDGVPPGRQPRAMNCRDAERIASRDRSARVIYGSNRDDGRWGRDDNGRWDPLPERSRGRAIPRRGPYPGAGGGYRYQNVAFDNGYNDGLDKGREDARDRDSYDPNRHSRYRSADRGYENRYGSKDDYRQIYREGFLAGYEDAYRGGYRGNSRSSGLPFPWPF